jgi:hypothetical protein
MRSVIVIISVALVILLSAFGAIKNFMSGIRGKVTPITAVKKVWAINTPDSAVLIPSSGNFTFELKPGSWKIYVEAVAPYKNVTLENIVVKEGNYTDAGEIKLSSDQRK